MRRFTLPSVSFLHNLSCLFPFLLFSLLLSLSSVLFLIPSLCVSPLLFSPLRCSPLLIVSPLFFDQFSLSCLLTRFFSHLFLFFSSGPSCVLLIFSLAPFNETPSITCAITISPMFLSPEYRCTFLTPCC